MGSVKERLADSEEPFCGYAHGQECPPTEEDVFHRIEEVWEDDDIKLATYIF